MKNIVIPILILFSSFFVEADNSDNTSTEKWEKTISENVAKVTTIQSSFRQDKMISFLSKKVVSSGRFILEKSGTESRIKWEYTTPFKYIIVIDGKKIMMKDGTKITKFDMSSSRVFEEINRIMVGSLNGTILNDSENFSFKIFEKEKELNVSMTPKAKSVMSKYFQTIEMTMDKSDFTVSMLRMVERTGDATDLFFTDKSVNKTIDPGEFKVE